MRPTISENGSSSYAKRSELVKALQYQRDMIKAINRTQIRGKIQGFIEDNFGTPAGEKVCFFEVGPLENYQKTHIPKAIQLSPTASDIEIKKQVASYLSNYGVEIILYGERPNENSVHHLAEVLSNAGYGNIFIYEAGKEDWIESGLWTQTTLVLADRIPRVT